MAKAAFFSVVGNGSGADRARDYGHQGLSWVEQEIVPEESQPKFPRFLTERPRHQSQNDRMEKSNDFAIAPAGDLLPWQYAPVEAKIKPLVDAMNATGVIQTVASCQGHATDCRYPYIYFKAQADVAARLVNTLREVWSTGAGPLHYLWTVKGMFNQDFDLVFTLVAPRLERVAVTAFRTFWDLWLHRAPLDADLLTLAGVVQDVLISGKVEVVRKPSEIQVHSG